MFLPLANSRSLTVRRARLQSGNWWGFIMRWVSTFDRYDLILAAAISGAFAVALSFGFI
jgi:hypothetical protein